MEKNHSALNWKNMLCWALIVLAFACNKDETPNISSDTDPVVDARGFFDRKGHPQPIDTMGVSYRYKKGALPLWDAAKVRQRGDTTIIFVPVVPQENFFIVNGDGDAQAALTPQLRAMKCAGKPWSFSLLTYVPEDGGEPVAGFTGTVLINDWFEGTTGYVHLYDGMPLQKNVRESIRKQMGWETFCYDKTVYGCVNGICKLYHVSGSTCITVYIEDNDNGQGPVPEEYDPPGGGPPVNSPPPPPPPTESWDINNEIDDPCLGQTINKALDRSEPVMGLITDIIRELDGDKSVEINVVDGVTPSGKPGEAINQDLTTVGGIPTKFSATIILHETYMQDVSQEGAVAIFIHEVLHAYLAKADLISGAQTNQHQTMATKYVAPMASYLQGLFGISQFDAFSLAWSGLTYTGAYASVTSFDIGGTTYSKSDIVQASAKYMGRGADGNLLKGKELCDD